MFGKAPPVFIKLTKGRDGYPQGYCLLEITSVFVVQDHGEYRAVTCAQNGSREELCVMESMDTIQNALKNAGAVLR